MMTLFFAGLMLTIGTALTAQINTPAPSPSCKYEQTVGLTDITVEYSRPGVKDREIFGGLVPYGQEWRLGANAATKMTFSTDVKIGGKELTAGSYAVTATPKETYWTLHFYPHTSNSVGTYMGDDAPESVDVTAEAGSMGDVQVESFMILIDGLRNSSALLHFAWANTIATTSIEVPTEKMVMDMITSTMEGPSANDYRAAARYYYEEGKDMKKALTWINKCIEKGGERFWILRDKALIEAALKDYSAAIKSAERSITLAKEAGNEDYVRMNSKSIEEWKSM
ncbi:MAG: DUF2911 domain-containing protein [Saprospiraceae bacterium]|nr:DUF2911 domain-containing protein [Saprospiraceae bacterium]